MNSACGASDFEADESRIKSQKEKESNEESATTVKSYGGSSNIESIKLAQNCGLTLGISIKGGVDHPFLIAKDDKAVDPGIYVIHVYDGGVASMDGRLLLGDRILSVNGENVEMVKQKDFLKILGKGSKRGGDVELTVKHNKALRKRLSSRKTSLPSIDPEPTSGGGFNSQQLSGVQMLTGDNVGDHFEPLEICANHNFLPDKLSTISGLQPQNIEAIINCNIHRESTPLGDFNSQQLGGVHMLTGSNAGGHFEPSEVCTNHNFLSNKLSTSRSCQRQIKEANSKHCRFHCGQRLKERIAFQMKADGAQMGEEEEEEEETKRVREETEIIEVKRSLENEDAKVEREARVSDIEAAGALRKSKTTESSTPKMGLPAVAVAVAAVLLTAAIFYRNRLGLTN